MKNYTQSSASAKIKRVGNAKESHGILYVNGATIGIGTLGAVDYLNRNTPQRVVVLDEKKYQRI